MDDGPTGAHMYTYFFLLVLFLGCSWEIYQRRVALEWNLHDLHRDSLLKNKTVRRMVVESLSFHSAPDLKIITVESHPRRIKISSVPPPASIFCLSRLSYRNTANVIFLHFIDLYNLLRLRPRDDGRAPSSSRADRSLRLITRANHRYSAISYLSFQRRSRTIVVRDRDGTTALEGFFDKVIYNIL